MSIETGWTLKWRNNNELISNRIYIFLDRLLHKLTLKNRSNLHLLSAWFRLLTFKLIWEEKNENEEITILYMFTNIIIHSYILTPIVSSHLNRGSIFLFEFYFSSNKFKIQQEKNVFAKFYLFFEISISSHENFFSLPNKSICLLVYINLIVRSKFFSSSSSYLDISFSWDNHSRTFRLLVVRFFILNFIYPRDLPVILSDSIFPLFFFFFLPKTKKHL